MRATDQTLTPAMRAALDRMVSDSRRLPVALALILGTLTLAIALLGRRDLAQATFFSLVFAGVGAALGGWQWRTDRRRRAAALAAGTFRHFSGPVRLQQVSYGRTTGWRVVAGEIALDIDRRADHDPSWLAEGTTEGTLLFTPAGRVLLAAWDRAGRRVFRARGYEIDGDGAIVQPVATGGSTGTTEPV